MASSINLDYCSQFKPYIIQGTGGDMMKRLFISLLTFLFSASSFAGFSKQNRNSVEQALLMYNSLKPAMIAQSIVTASPTSEKDFLSLTFKDLTNPKAVLKGDQIFIEGAKFPLKIIDLNKGKFTLNGFVLDFQSQTSVESQLTKIQNILEGNRFSKIDLIFPKAYAVAFLPVVKAIYVAGAAVVAIGCLVASESKSPGCLVLGAAWPVIGAGVIVLEAIASVLPEARAAEIPTKYECNVDGSVTVYGSGTKKVKIMKDGEGYTSEPKNKNSAEQTFSAAAMTLAAACKVAPEGISKLNTAAQGSSASNKKDPIIPSSGAR